MIKVVVLLVALISVVVAKPSGWLLPPTTPSGTPTMKPTLPDGLVPPPPPTVNTTVPALPPYQPPVFVNPPPQIFVLVDCPPVIQYW